MPTLVLTYPAILKLFGIHAVNERSNSRAFLAWFPENYYHLDQMEVSDCICDDRYDKGIDGIYVNEQLAQIDVFQSFLAHTDKTIGDTKLKEFAGSLSQFQDKATVENLMATCKNPALVSLLTTNEIATKVADRFSVRGVFITNVARDQNAKAFLSHHKSITLFDKGELQSKYAPLDRTPPIAPEVSFSTDGIPYLEYSLKETVFVSSDV